MPKTLENYSQEVGRAGRDGLPSACLMFLAASDIPVLEGFARGDTCSKKDLQLWMQEVVLKQPAKDGSLDFNHYQQSRTWVLVVSVFNVFLIHNHSLFQSYDIRVCPSGIFLWNFSAKLWDPQPNVLGLCYAQLELDYDYIRAITPFYSVYELSARSPDGWRKVMADKSKAGDTVRRYWSPRGSLYTVNTVRQLSKFTSSDFG